MRDREFEGELPSIRATADERPGTLEPQAEKADKEIPNEPLRSPVRSEPKGSGNGALWALCAALSLGLVGLGYWSHQQQTRLQQQLVATQNSFARISEEAAGRIQDITGKVSATESTLSETEQARAAQLTALEKGVQELTRKLEQQASTLASLQQSGEARQRRLDGISGQANELQERLEAQSGRLGSLDEALKQGGQRHESLAGELGGLREEIRALAGLEQRIGEQAEQLRRQQSTLQSLSNQASARNLDQEMLVLRSEIDQRLSSTEDALAAIDSYRLQTNRTLNTLQNQLNTLQQRVGQP
ncbi:ATPase [Pseudomonas jilinensis]|uniref:ATPase n=1 Tax=Pseudomonas jilinensis TaxID=2078689 RepID=A0A396RTP5_9PSED|nr:ATPase [Pseudomonas jilinensis]RHW19709.1 ATPase [Pseudomonas jilinensis]